MNEHSENNPVEIFSGSSWQAGMVRSLLANSEIESFSQDEIIGTLNPWQAAPGGAGAIRVFVANKDADTAKIIVDEYEKNLNENT